MAPGKRDTPSSRFEVQLPDRASLRLEQGAIASAIEQALSSRPDARVQSTDRATLDIHVEIGPAPASTIAADIRYEFGYWLVEFDDGQTLVGFQDTGALVQAVAGKLTPRPRRGRT